jgi:hypothetical protein
MWGAYIFTGLMGMVTNILLVAGTVVESRLKKAARKLPSFVSSCAILGLLFNFIDTIPVAALGRELPCANDCDDEYCHGESWLCKLQQPSEYLLLASFALILKTLLELYMKAVLSKTPKECGVVVRRYTVMASLSIVLLIGLCLAADTDLLATGSTEYRQLIVARDGFSCAPRYSSATQELLLQTLPFMVVCLALVALTVGMVRQIWVMMQKTPGSSASGTMNKFGKVAGKLLLLAQLVTILWLVRVSVAATQKPLIEGFNLDTQAFADCTLQASMSSTWQSSNGGYVELCSAIPDTGSEMLTSVVLMLCVKNLQSWIVGLVWGFSFFASTVAKSGLSTRFSGKSSGKSSASVGVSSKNVSVASSMTSSAVAE